MRIGVGGSPESVVRAAHYMLGSSEFLGTKVVPRVHELLAGTALTTGELTSASWPAPAPLFALVGAWDAGRQRAERESERGLGGARGQARGRGQEPA